MHWLAPPPFRDVLWSIAKPILVIVGSALVSAVLIWYFWVRP